MKRYSPTHRPSTTSTPTHITIAIMSDFSTLRSPLHAPSLAAKPSCVGGPLSCYGELRIGGVDRLLLGSFSQAACVWAAAPPAVSEPRSSPGSVCKTTSSQGSGESLQPGALDHGLEGKCLSDGCIPKVMRLNHQCHVDAGHATFARSPSFGGRHR